MATFMINVYYFLATLQMMKLGQEIKDFGEETMQSKLQLRQSVLGSVFSFNSTLLSGPKLLSKIKLPFSCLLSNFTLILIALLSLVIMVGYGVGK